MASSSPAAGCSRTSAPTVARLRRQRLGLASASTTSWITAAACLPWRPPRATGRTSSPPGPPPASMATTGAGCLCCMQRQPSTAAGSWLRTATTPSTTTCAASTCSFGTPCGAPPSAAANANTASVWLWTRRPSPSAASIGSSRRSIGARSPRGRARSTHCPRASRRSSFATCRSCWRSSGPCLNTCSPDATGSECIYSALGARARTSRSWRRMSTSVKCRAASRARGPRRGGTERAGTSLQPRGGRATGARPSG
mmetsp:Transcript_23572/g.68832  ORF Transcript_23572/g.68832 Transcript_23572/m.68832 type:complete len:255 (+) Transcript_23572:335-1099(+)